MLVAELVVKINDGRVIFQGDRRALFFCYNACMIKGLLDRLENVAVELLGQPLSQHAKDACSRKSSQYTI